MQPVSLGSRRGASGRRQGPRAPLPDSPEPYRLRIALEAGVSTCLWSANAAAHARYGYAVSLADLPLAPDTSAAAAALISRFDAIAAPQSQAEVDTGATLFGGEAAAAGFADEIQRLSARLQADLGPGFLVEHDFDAPDRRAIIGWNRIWTRRATLGSLVASAAISWFAYAIAFDGFGDLSGEGRIILSLTFAAFGALFLAASVTYGLASYDLGSVVTIDASGVLDRRLSSAPIPWERIGSVTPLQHGGQLMLTLNVKDPRAQRLPRNPLWIVNRLAARIGGQPELAIKLTGLDTDLPLLLAEVTRRRR